MVLFRKHSLRLIVKRLNLFLALDWSFVAYGKSIEWVLLMAGKGTHNSLQAQIMQVKNQKEKKTSVPNRVWRSSTM